MYNDENYKVEGEETADMRQIVYDSTENITQTQ
jgi:hypothetical protein